MHAHDRQRRAVAQGHIEPFAGAVAARGVDGTPVMSRPSKPGKASGDRRIFARVEDRGADTAAGPVRVQKNAAIFAASVAGSSSSSSRCVQWSAPKSVRRLLQPPQPAITWSSVSATKYEPSAMSCVSTPKTDARAPSISTAV